jgi:hypothetical protein
VCGHGLPVTGCHLFARAPRLGSFGLSLLPGGFLRESTDRSGNLAWMRHARDARPACALDGHIESRERYFTNLRPLGTISRDCLRVDPV